MLQCPLSQRNALRSAQALQRLHRLWLLNFRSAFLASAACIVIPEIEHRLAEMFDDVRAVEMDVFYQCPAIFAVENDVFFFSRRTAPLDNHTDRVRRPLRGMRNIWRDKERFAFSDDMIDNAVPFANAHLDVALELVKVLLRIDEMKIVPRVWPLDDHHEKIPAIVEITIAHRRLKFVGVLLAVALSSWQRAYLAMPKASNRGVGSHLRVVGRCDATRRRARETTITPVRTDI